MGMKIIRVRGRTFGVEAKHGSQLAFVKRMFEQRSDEQLDRYQQEYDNDVERRTSGSVEEDQEAS